MHKATNYIAYATVTPSTVDPGVTVVESGRPRWLYRDEIGKLASTVALRTVTPALTRQTLALTRCQHGRPRRHPGVNMVEPGTPRCQHCRPRCRHGRPRRQHSRPRRNPDPYKKHFFDFKSLSTWALKRQHRRTLREKDEKKKRRGDVWQEDGCLDHWWPSPQPTRYTPAEKRYSGRDRDTVHPAVNTVHP